MKESTTEVKPHRVQVFISQVLYHTRPAYRYDPQCLKNIFFTSLPSSKLTISQSLISIYKHYAIDIADPSRGVSVAQW